MNNDDFLNYLKVYNTYIKDIKEPTVFVYLKTSTEVLIERIQRRGRDFEQSIDKTYLQTITKYYDLFFENLPSILPKTKLIVCDTDSKNKLEVFEFISAELNKLKN